jgi:S-methylmethionine-dependent homocysteine/selenocysteine methylase
VSKYYHDPKFRAQAAEYYDVEAAERMLNAPVPEGCERWRCVLCGWPIDITEQGAKVIGACCCGGCGMTTLRPIKEFR